jgi:hypothetical protein
MSVFAKYAWDNEHHVPMNLTFIKNEIYLQERMSADPEIKTEDYEKRQTIIKHLISIGQIQRNLEVRWSGPFKTVIAPPDYFLFDEGGEFG